MTNITHIAKGNYHVSVYAVDVDDIHQADDGRWFAYAAVLTDAQIADAGIILRTDTRRMLGASHHITAGTRQGVMHQISEGGRELAKHQVRDCTPA